MRSWNFQRTSYKYYKIKKKKHEQTEVHGFSCVCVRVDFPAFVYELWVRVVGHELPWSRDARIPFLCNNSSVCHIFERFIKVIIRIDPYKCPGGRCIFPRGGGGGGRAVIKD